MIRVRTLLTCLVVLVLSGVASAQTSLYGSLNCDMANASDRRATATKPGDAAAAEEKCTWTLPLEIGADVAVGAQNSFTSNKSGANSKDTGTHTTRMANSDQFVLNFTGTTVFDGSGQPRSRQGTWTFASGTGLLKGITGKGTYTGLARAAGGMSYDIEGGYNLPGKAAAATPSTQGTGAPAGNPPASNIPGQGNAGKPTS